MKRGAATTTIRIILRMRLSSRLIVLARQRASFLIKNHTVLVMF
jgi:hypothetical protein